MTNTPLPIIEIVVVYTVVRVALATIQYSLEHGGLFAVFAIAVICSITLGLYLGQNNLKE